LLKSCIFHCNPSTSGRFNFTTSLGVIVGGALDALVDWELCALCGAR
jgi:hypothetical protein